MRRTPILLLVGAVILASSCDSSTSTHRVPAGSVFHQANLAEGETSEVAELLIDVPGYLYLDATATETLDFLERVRKSGPGDDWSGGSLHSVVDREGDEVAFLQLLGFAPGVTPDVLTEQVATHLWGSAPESSTDIAGRPVYLFENPEHPDSRYTFVWLMDNTLLVADSGDKEQILRWIHAYLPAL